MSSPLAPRKIENLGVYGVIREAEVDYNLIPDQAVTEAINFHFDRKGACTVRPGLAGFGSTVLNARPCFGLHNAQSGTAISVFSNGSSATIYSFDGSSWNLSLDGGTASVAIRFLDFGSYTLALNFAYNTYTSIRFWNAGSSRHWHNTGNPINPQNMWGYANNVGEVYKSRIYLAGDTSKEGSGSRLYFSSIISSAGNITWAPTTDFVDINPGDGESITALKRYSLELLVFKPNYIYRFKTSGTDPDPLIKVGTRSQESVVEGKRGVYFHHDSGFYRYSGGYPIEISRAISDVVDAISYSQFGSITAWNDNDHIYWSVGNLTISEVSGSITWRNVVLRYTESSELWTVYSYASDPRRGITYTRGTTLSRILGLDNGVVVTQNSGVTDLGEPIKFRLRTKWYEWDSIATRKFITEMVANCEKAQGIDVMYQVDENYSWNTIGQLKKLTNWFTNLNVRFHRIRFQIIGTSRFEAPVFRSLEILQGIDEGLVKEPSQK